MKIAEPYLCDSCGIVKGGANHWWLRDVPHATSVFILRPWDDELAAKETYQHLCSEACASKALSQWMANVQRAATPGPRKTEEPA